MVPSGGLAQESDALLSAETFDPETLRFAATSSLMHVARAHPLLRVLADGKVQSFIDGHEVVKVIVVPQRLVNVVVKVN